MATLKPTPAYWKWTVYNDVPLPASTDAADKGLQSPSSEANPNKHSAHTRINLSSSAANTDNDSVSKCQSYTLHVRESLITPLALEPKAATEEISSLPSVVLVHGMVVSGSYLAACGTSLASYMRVFIPDLPGYGQSANSLVEPSDCLSVADQAGLLASWMERAGLVTLSPPRKGETSRPPPPFLIGNSMGCSVIIELARRYPHCVRGAVLQGPVQDEAVAGTTKQIIQFILNGRNEPFHQGLQVLKDWHAAGWRRVIATWQAMRAFHSEEGFRKTKAPMLLLGGELDTVSPLDWCLHLASKRKGVSVATLIDTPHTAVTTAPECVGEIVRLYFGKILDQEEQEPQGGALDDDASIPEIEAPRVTTDFSLKKSDVLRFIFEAIPMVLMPTMLLTLVTTASWGLFFNHLVAHFLTLYSILFVCAATWRVLHRRRLLSRAKTHNIALWSPVFIPPTIPGVADFDSATAFLRAHALALRGHDVPFLGRPPFLGDRVVTWLLNHLPDRVRILAYAILGATEATPSILIGRNLDGNAVADKVIDHYPLDTQYPAIALGSSSGSLSHVYHALHIPWLPNTLMFGVARPAPSRQRPRFEGLSKSEDDLIFDLTAELEWGRKAGGEVLKNNPLWQLHHMADPCQDSLMVAWMSYFRLKQSVLLPQFKEFILKRLKPGGTLLLSDCKLKWAGVQVDKEKGRHFFQMGAYGGLDPDEYVQPNLIVDCFLRQEILLQKEHDIRRAQESEDHILHWNAPIKDMSECDWAPEAEWGLPLSFRADVETFAKENGFKVVIVQHDDPQDLSQPVADLFREWQSRGRREALLDGLVKLEAKKVQPSKPEIEERMVPIVPSRLSPSQQHLFVSQFVFVEPWWTARTGCVPFWTVFSTRNCNKALKKYLHKHSESEESNEKEASLTKRLSCRFRSASAALFPHGVRSCRFADVHSWISLLRDPLLLSHPQQCTSSDTEPSLPQGGTVLVGVLENLFPRDFQTVLHFHEQVHLLSQQRYPMPLRRRQGMNFEYALKNLEALVKDQNASSESSSGSSSNVQILSKVDS